MSGAKIALSVVGGFLALILVIALLQLTGVYVFGSLQRKTADYRGGTKVIEKTKANGDYRIAAYDQFFDLCGAIQANQQKLALLKEQLKDDPDDAWLKQTITGIEAGLADQVAQYNADAAKAGTRGQFRDSRLPYHISMDETETQCAL